MARIVELPQHLKWSGPRTFDLDDELERRYVYQVVLREGGAADVRRHLDPDELDRMLPDLVLPPHIRAALADWRAARSAQEWSVLIDLGQDARIRTAEQGPLGALVALEESAADKVLALFGRAEARDFVDVQALAGRLGRERLLELAAEKDLGLDRYVFATALGTFDALPRRVFDLDEAAHEALRSFVREWRTALLRKVLG